MITYLETRVRPKMKTAAVWMFFATMVLWGYIYFTAPDDYRGRLGDEMQKLFDTFYPNLGKSGD